MAPTRRYLRISKFSVLECRIYLDNPALANSWLLNPRGPVLPRIIARIKPLVLPKLREERERQRTGKGKKSKAIKDVVVEDDYEVSIFFQDRKSTSHSLLTKQKTFHDANPQIIKSSNKDAIEVGEDGQLTKSPPPAILVEDDDEEQRGLSLQDIPAAQATVGDKAKSSDSRQKKKKKRTQGEKDMGSSRKRRKRRAETGEEDENEDEADSAVEPAVDNGEDDKKKLLLDTSYDGFRIYGLTLCMVVHRRQQQPPAQGGENDKSGGGSKTNSVGRAIMEDWIASTTGQHEVEVVEDDDS